MPNFTKPTSPALQAGGLATSLLRCYLFNEGSGAAVTDYSSNGAHLTVTSGTPWATDATYGKYLSFDGTTQRGSGADTNLPTGSDARTISFLFKATTGAYVFSWGTTGSSAYVVAFDSGTATKPLIASTLASNATGAVGVTDGAWHRAYIVDNGTTVSFYIDGVLDRTVASPTETTALSGTAWLASTTGLNYWPLVIGGLQAWGTALTAGEITSLEADYWQAIRPGAATLTLTPSTQSAATGAAASLTATLTGITGALTATTTAGTLSTTTPTSGTAFTLTLPASGSGTATVTVTGPSSTSASATVTYPVGAGIYAVTDANRFFAPGAFYSDGAGAMQANNIKGSSTYAETTDLGYGRTVITGTATASLVVDVSKMAAAGIAATDYPVLCWSIDGGAVQVRQLVSTDTAVSLAAGLSTGASHTIEWWVRFMTAAVDTWTSPTASLKVGNLILATTGSTVAPAVLPDSMAGFGDSISAGSLVQAGATLSVSSDARQSWLYDAAAALNCELWQWGKPSMGYQSNGGSNNIPVFNLHPWKSYSSGRPRLVGGLLPTTLKYALVNMGTNGTTASSDVSACLTNLRAACGPSTRIVMVVPFGGFARSAINAGFAAYQAATPDANAKIVDLGDQPGLAGSGGTATISSFDGIHPTGPASLTLGARVAAAVVAAFGGGGGINGSAILGML